MSDHRLIFFLRGIAWPAAIVAGLAVGLAMAILASAPKSSNAGILPPPEVVAAPPALAETGLYSDPAALTIDPEHIAFAPQYPLWTDGAEKRRWISLPPGEVIDTSNPDAWDFPIGTRLWKEFTFNGRKVETRYMERLPDGSWLFASYGWRDDGQHAQLVSEKGRKGAHPLGDGRSHAIPSTVDCRICHLSGPVPVLGFSAQQLFGDNNSHVPRTSPAALLSPDLDTLNARGILAGVDEQLFRDSWSDGTDLERQALGYLHGNCGHCHNSVGQLAKLGMDLRLPASESFSGAVATAVGHRLKSPPAGLAPGTELRIAPGHPDLSAIPQRMASRLPALQMPPLGTALVDAEGIALINRWIAEMETVSKVARHNKGEK